MSLLLIYIRVKLYGLTGPIQRAKMIFMYFEKKVALKASFHPMHDWLQTWDIKVKLKLVSPTLLIPRKSESLKIAQELDTKL